MCIPYPGKLVQIEDQGAGFNPRAKPSHHYPINDSRKGNKSTATTKHDILSHLIPHLYHHCFSHALSRSSDMFSFSDMLTIKLPTTIKLVGGRFFATEIFVF